MRKNKYVGRKGAIVGGRCEILVVVEGRGGGEGGGEIGGEGGGKGKR